jgi:MoaA/NifB/PqqE/SkfB family radical SAM enzyme
VTPKEMLTNPYFCPMPWTGMMYNFDGEVKNCIRSAGKLGNIKEQPIQQILIDNNQPRQNHIVNQQPVDTCHTCYDLEDGNKGLNIISDRVFYIRELKHTSPAMYTTGNFNLQAIDIRWTNLCNFACVYCGPMFSSKWANELKVIQQGPSQEQIDQFKQYVFEHAAQLKHVYLAGGEPLLMKENLELLLLLKKTNPSVNLRINTNLSKVDTQVFDLVCGFKNVHWTVSVETVEQEFEYIRYGGSWADFQENLAVIKNLDHKISFNMLHFLLNYQSIFDCVDYLKSLGFHNNSFIIGALLDPEYLNVRHLPDHVLHLLKHTLEDKINQQPKYLLEQSYRNMLSYLNQPFEKNLTGAFEKLQVMDQRRRLDSKTIFQNLYNLI